MVDTPASGSVIYCIRNLRDGTQYIGSTVHRHYRWGKHRRDLRKAADEASLGLPERQHHKNLHLQRAWVRDGEESFVFEVLEECPPAVLHQREQHYILTATSPLYNVAKDTTAPMRGRKQTPEHIARRMAATVPKMRGRKHTAEHRANIAASQVGKKRSAEARANMSAASKAKKGKYPISASRRAALQAYAATDDGRALYSEKGKRGAAARWQARHAKTVGTEQLPLFLP